MKTTGRVNGIISNIVIVKADGAVAQNEICYVYAGDTRMMAEVIKVIGDAAYVQVFDSTRGLKIGDRVEFEGHMLEATLAPGLLSRNYDGLQNDLEKMEGLFIARGSVTEPIDFSAQWEFTPLAAAGDKVSAASWLGEVKEQWVMHKIMVPFTMTGTYTVKSVAKAGKYKVTDTIAVVTDAEGRDHEVTMVQKWPVKQAIRCYREKPRPSRVMETGVRAIDTFNPMAEGGTGFIPGPFGAGKTVLQHAISKQADADVIIMVACGERANEVVEIFKEFPELVDPRTGHKLMERTIIICNTSNMPVAAREASVYTGMTIGEYYRAMGLKVLVMADSTSRWAQALREMSNRLEELPGQDAFPMDLSAIISNFYSCDAMGDILEQLPLALTKEEDAFSKDLLLLMLKQYGLFLDSFQFACKNFKGNAGQTDIAKTIGFESNEEYNEIMFLREITHTINAFNEMADVVRLYSKKPKTAEQRLANLLSEVLYEDSESV